jgi:hypothetical protein
MQSILASVLATILLVLTARAPAAGQGHTPTKEAIKLVNQGNVDRAILVLSEYLKKNGKDVQARVALGQILDMDMNIAGALDELADPRAVPPLIEVLNPENADAGAPGGGPLSDRGAARRRAALALGAFDTAEARRALEAGTRIPEVAGACWAALYRRSHDPKQLAALEHAVTAEHAAMSYYIGEYLRSKVGTEEAKKLAETWQKRRDEADAAAKTKAKTEAPQEPE